MNSNEKVVSYFFNIDVIIVAMGISCQADHVVAQNMHS